MAGQEHLKPPKGILSEITLEEKEEVVTKEILEEKKRKQAIWEKEREAERKFLEKKKRKIFLKIILCLIG